MNAAFAQSRAAGVTGFARAEVAAVLASRIGMRPHHFGVDNIMFAAITVQQAKNGSNWLCYSCVVRVFERGEHLARLPR